MHGDCCGGPALSSVSDGDLDARGAGFLALISSAEAFNCTSKGCKPLVYGTAHMRTLLYSNAPSQEEIWGKFGKWRSYPESDGARETGGSSSALAAEAWLLSELWICSETDRTAAASDEAGKVRRKLNDRGTKVNERGKEERREDSVEQQKIVETRIFS